MAPILSKQILQGGKVLHRIVDTSALNAQLVLLSKPGAGASRVVRATIKYSASVTLDVLIELLSGAGTAFNTIIRKLQFAANTDGLWVPDRDNELIMPDDQIRITCPAGGAGITSSAAFYQEQL